MTPEVLQIVHLPVMLIICDWLRSRAGKLLSRLPVSAEVTVRIGKFKK